MSSFVDFFYPLPARRRTAGAVILWWEKRRLAYNLIVGGVGCATIAVTTALFALPVFRGGPPFEFIIAGSIFYGIMANLCYCLGPLVELAMYHFWGDEAPRAGPALFRQGLIFSVGLTLFPIALAGVGIFLRALSEMLN